MQYLLSTRLALAAILTLSGLALLIEVVLYFQTRPFQQALDGGGYDSSIAVGVSWGFWGAVAVNVAALVAEVTLFIHAGPRARSQAARAHQPAIG